VAAGCAEVTFAKGARVIVEGPVRFTVDSPTEMSLATGKLAATVAGGGFIVRTPAATVTDLGTEFGVDATADGATHVEVFTGRVEAALRAAADGTEGSM